MVQKFNMSRAWDDAVQMLRSTLSLTLPIVGIFVLLPMMAFLLVGPVLMDPPADADVAQLLENLSSNLRNIAPVLVMMSLLSSLAGVAVSRLWLAPGGASVGEAIGFAVAAAPTLIGLFVLQSIALGLAFALFILPALYLGGRLAPAFAVMATGVTRNPLTVLQESWDMTRGNGWRIAAMLILIQLVIQIAATLVEGVGGVLGPRGSLGHALASMMSGAVTALGALVMFSLGAAIYRQLTWRSASDVFH
jgi:hypothetical protein